MRHRMTHRITHFFSALNRRKDMADPTALTAGTSNHEQEHQEYPPSPASGQHQGNQRPAYFGKLHRRMTSNCIESEAEPSTSSRSCDPVASASHQPPSHVNSNVLVGNLSGQGVYGDAYLDAAG